MSRASETSFPEIRLRPAEERDIPFLLELRRVTMQGVITNHYPWENGAQTERVMLHFECARMVSLHQESSDGGPENRNFIPETDAGLLKVIPLSTGLELCQIQLLPAWQGRGLGTRLIRMVQGEAKAAGLPLTLHVLRSNPALALYRKLGFQIVESDAHSHTMRWSPAFSDPPEAP
ncbi:MAG: GNAT family N-acetyltransferase [Verrucomicrobiota bacterium]